MATSMRAMVLPQPFKITKSNQKIKTIQHHSSFKGQYLPKSNNAAATVHRMRICTSAQQTTDDGATVMVDNAVAILRQAAVNARVPSGQVFEALRSLEQAKLPTDDWAEQIGSGKRWRLVFTSGTKEVQKAMKGATGGGKYFPITAVQRWDAGEIENGIFLGHLAALTFSGPYSMKGKKLSFDFDTLKIRIGPGKFSFKLKDKITEYAAPPKDPFFLFFYVGEDLVAARGRGGGIAFWAKTSPAWELQNGVV